MVAGVLHRLGVFMGEHLLGSDVSNTSGHYEDLEFLAINKAILRDAGGSWRHPPSHEAIMSVTKYDRQMAALVARRDAEHELWGWKDPRTALTLGKWRPLLSDPLFVRVWRKQEHTVASLTRRNGMSSFEARQLCALYAGRAYDVLRYEPKERVRFCKYAAMCRQKCRGVKQQETAQLGRLAAAIGVSVTTDAWKFVDPSLNHWDKMPCA